MGKKSGISLPKIELGRKPVGKKSKKQEVTRRAGETPEKAPMGKYG